MMLLEVVAKKLMRGLRVATHEGYSTLPLHPSVYGEIGTRWEAVPSEMNGGTFPIQRKDYYKKPYR